MKHGAPVLGPWHRRHIPLCPRPLAKRERPRAKRHSSHAARRLIEVQHLQPPLAASTVLLQPGPAGEDCCETRRPSAADAHARCVVAQLGSARLNSGPKRPDMSRAPSCRERHESLSTEAPPPFSHCAGVRGEPRTRGHAGRERSKMRECPRHKSRIKKRRHGAAASSVELPKKGAHPRSDRIMVYAI